MATGPGRVDEKRREPSDPVQGDVIDFDPTLSEELLDVAIRQAEPQMPPHCEHDHLRWEPEAFERRTWGDVN
jgi:hypothetical protein